MKWSLRSMFVLTFIVALACAFHVGVVPGESTLYYVYNPHQPHKVLADDHLKALYWGPFWLWRFEPHALTADWRDMTSEEERELRDSDDRFWKTQREWRKAPR